MASSDVRVAFDELRSIDSSTLTGSYQVVGSTFSSPIIMLKIVNDANEDVTVSYDGSTDQDFVPANGFTLYDFNTNHYASSRGGGGAFQLAVGEGVYVKGTAGTGTIYVVAIAAG